MRYWLVKSEPDVFSFGDLQKAKTTAWTGVRNYQARNLLRDELQVGDGVLYYHSSVEPMGVAGLATVAHAGYPDPTQFDKKSEYYDQGSTKQAPRWFAVDIRADKQLRRYVTLEELKGEKALTKMVLLNRSRLSVQPVSEGEWARIVKMGG